MYNPNNIEHQYLDLIQEVLDKGHTRSDRTGTGTISLFGKTLRHNFKYGFPAFTTKKLAWKQVVGELLWMLSGSTNIKPMVDQGNYIWVGDAYKKFTESLMYNFSGEVMAYEVHKHLTKEQFIDKIKTDQAFADKWGSLGEVYGAAWRKWSGAEYTPCPDEKETVEQQWYRMGMNNVANRVVDQVSNIIHLLKTDPDSRRMLVSAWNPLLLHKAVLPPCHYSWQVYTRELTWEEQVQWVMGNTDVEMENLYITEEVYKPTTPTRAISLSFNMRSNDLLLGNPFNTAGYSLLLHILAKLTNMVPDELICNIGDAHIYSNHVEGAREQLKREPYPCPKLHINTKRWARNEQGEFTDDLTALVASMKIEDFQLEGYQHHPKIYFPLSN